MAQGDFMQQEREGCGWWSIWLVERMVHRRDIYAVMPHEPLLHMVATSSKCSFFRGRTK
jgi:hypothetical protein